MSADNGIYVLETNTETAGVTEFRVSHLQAIDNIAWDCLKHECTDDEDVRIFNARRMWTGPVYKNREDAMKYAQELSGEFDILEYGISSIRINRDFGNSGHALRQDLERQIAIANNTITKFPRFRSREEFSWGNGELCVFDALHLITDPTLKNLVETVCYGEIRPVLKK